MSSKSSGQNPFATLRQFVRQRAPVEVCEMCSKELASDHQHLIEPLNRKLLCACDACAILFSSQADTRYKRVPRRIRFLNDFRLTDGQWESLAIPINMAFFFNSTPAGRVVAFYPSPAGPTESLLGLDSWDEIVQANPVLKQMEPDTEALLVNRVGSARGLADAEYYVVPVDECYKLVGLIRAHWRGLSGGTKVWEEIGEFFARLKERASPAREGTNA
ncbi:MAG TPA: DUF5947 family protein [Blastocatellia bacterium]|nr:DUF5947 family protein [Blastocatellia bacterium]